MPTHVTIFTKPGCPYCAAARKYYSEQGVAFKEFDVKSKPEYAAAAMKLADGSKVVPVIVEDGKVTVGFGGS
jgi:glutaredoxin